MYAMKWAVRGLLLLFPYANLKPVTTTPLPAITGALFSLHLSAMLSYRSAVWWRLLSFAYRQHLPTYHMLIDGGHYGNGVAHLTNNKRQ